MQKKMDTPFPIEKLRLVTGPDEEIIRGGRSLFNLLGTAFTGVKQIGVIGWGSQGPAQSQNLRDSLASVGSDIKVVMGLQAGSGSVSKAKEAGFSSDNGTLGEMYGVVSKSDLVILLISDGGQTEVYPEVFAAMKPGSTLGLSHGFLEGYLSGIGGVFPSNINVVMVAPKGMGPSVRRLYLQGKDTGGSGINSSVAIHQDVTGSASRIATGWSVAIGSPVTFQTTIPMEWRSDLFGERAILLGGMWGMLEALYKHFLKHGKSEEFSFEQSVLALTSFISPQISKLGLDGFYQQHVQGRYEGPFVNGYASAYLSFRTVMERIYENVSSGQEISDVVIATRELKNHPMPSIELEPMWQVGKRVRESGKRITEMEKCAAFTAGVYVAGVMEQFRLLRSKGHCISEIVNESLIEGTDSLTPFMDARGVAYMADNCSITARLGTRRYGPEFQESISHYIGLGLTHLEFPYDWLSDIIHRDVATCYQYKPSVSIVTA